VKLTGFRTGGWMPADHRQHREWLKKQVEHVDAHPQKLPPVLEEFKDLIEKNPRIHMYFTAMFDEVPVKRYPTPRIYSLFSDS